MAEPTIGSLYLHVSDDQYAVEHLTLRHPEIVVAHNALVEMVLEQRKVVRQQAKDIERLELWIGRLRGRAELDAELFPPPVGDQLVEVDDGKAVA